MKEVLLGEVLKNADASDQQVSFYAFGMLGELRTAESPLDTAQKIAIVVVHDTVSPGESEAWIDFEQGDFDTEEQARAIIMSGLEHLGAARLLSPDAQDLIESSLVGQVSAASID